jgi:hypothetical protein
MVWKWLGNGLDISWKAAGWMAGWLARWLRTLLYFLYIYIYIYIYILMHLGTTKSTWERLNRSWQRPNRPIWGRSGLAWSLLGFPGVSCARLVSPRLFRGLLGSPGLPWSILESPGLSWAPLGSPGLSWPLLVSPGLLGSSSGISWALSQWGVTSGCGFNDVLRIQTYPIFSMGPLSSRAVGCAPLRYIWFVRWPRHVPNNLIIYPLAQTCTK